MLKITPPLVMPDAEPGGGGDVDAVPGLELTCGATVPIIASDQPYSTLLTPPISGSLLSLALQ